MPGRPKMMAKRVDAFYRRAWALCGDMLEVIPDQYHAKGLVLPEWADEEVSLLSMASESEGMELHWRVCIGHALGLQAFLNELTNLLENKAGLPATVDLAQQVPGERGNEHQNAQDEQPADAEPDNPTGAEGPEVAA